MRWLLLVLFVGCAGPHREFRDGAPVRAPVAEPRAAYTPAGAGLPEYWGQPVESVERSPHARVLPQTPETRREDGLWAAHDERRTPILLDLFPPMSPDARTDWDYEVPEQCARSMMESLRRTETIGRALSLPTNIRLCLAARLYRMCGDEWMRDVNAPGSTLALMTEMARGVRLMQQPAHELEQTLCKSQVGPTDADLIFAAVSKDFRAARGRR